MRLFLALLSRLDWVLVAILVLALALRLWAINFGLPYLYHPDEGVPVNIALQIIRTSDFNPHFYNWPSLLFYLNAIVYYGYFLFGRLTGAFSSPNDLPYLDIQTLAVGKTALPAEFLLSRGLVAVFGTLSVVWVYLICRQLGAKRATGWLAALLFAVESVGVRNSQFIRPDTFLVFFSLWAMLYALKILDEPLLRNDIFFGICAGLAIASKYNAALILIPFLVAHWFESQSGMFRKKGVYFGILVSVVVFLLTTPFALFDSQHFIENGLIEISTHYSTGHPGAEGNSFQWYSIFLLSTQRLNLIFAMIEAALIIYARSRNGIDLLSYPIIYFAFISRYDVHFDSTVLPVIPFLVILSALFVERLYGALVSKWCARRELIASLFGVCLVLPPLSSSVASNVRLLQSDGREHARVWIETNLPLGSRIALESYSPYLDPKKFVVNGFGGIQDHVPEWYIQNGFEYLVFSEGIYGRYFADPNRYAAEIERYNSLFTRFIQVARFDQNDFEIRIYKTDVALPSHRVSARFGNSGEIIELVGYDSVQQTQDDSLTLKLYWRPISSVPEPLELEMRLLAKDDREVAKVRADLFQNKGWQDHLFEALVTIPTKNAASGSYRFQLTVTQTRFSYNLPAMNWAGEAIDPVLVGPFEIK